MNLPNLPYTQKSTEKGESNPILTRGRVNKKDLIAPAYIDRSHPDYLVVDNKYVRNFIMAGYPKQISVGWADNLYDYDGDLDIAIHVRPMDERLALNELTTKITQFQAQLQTELERGSNRNITKLQAAVSDLYEERRKIEQNYISLFGIQMVMNLYSDSLDRLRKEGEVLESSMRGKKAKLMTTAMRQDQGYKSALPFGKSWLPQNFRNFSSEGLTACFPFYSSEISHPSGVFIGSNTQTRTPIFLDFYNRKLLDSGNTTVFGMTGSGKSYFVSLLTIRSALQGIRTAIVDPEGEYRRVTEAIGGVVVEIKPDGTVPNPFDVHEEAELDSSGRPTGKKVVKLQEKIIDLLNLIGLMCGNLTNEQKSLITIALKQTYTDFGITEEASSLLLPGACMDENGDFVHYNRRKPIPRLSDFHERLKNLSESHPQLRSVCNTLLMFLCDGTFGMFDVQTPKSLADMSDAPVICFDVSSLEQNALRPIGMYIALSWCNEKFIKQKPQIRKRIVCDEAWMLIKNSMPGAEYTANFLESVARRIRKRNGTLLVASQNFKEFVENPQGEAVLTNTQVNIFLKQNATDIEAVQDKFKLSDGEREFLASTRQGNYLLKIGQDSTTGYALAFPHEKRLIEKEPVSEPNGD